MARFHSLMGAAGLAFVLATPPLHAQDNGFIPLPPDQDGSPVISEAEIDRLNSDRVEAERHRGNFVEDLAVDPSIVSPLRPVAARGRPAGSAIRFDGERRTLDFALFIPRPEEVRAMRVSTMSSINVLPERSHYRVYVNGAMVGEGRLENFTGFGTLDFPLDGAQLRSGQNDVRIELVQYHRIYCGPEASFALWSDIDLANSGAVLASAEGISGQEGFMMGLAAAAATGAGIEIRGAAGLGAQREAWVSDITQRISGALGGDPIPFRFTEYWSVQSNARSAARITFLPSAANRVSFRVAGDGAQVMVVEFVPGEPPRALPEFDTALPRLAEHAQPTLIGTERPVPFSDFGFETTEIYDHYTRIDTRFRLPDDYVVLTNEKAEIALDYIFVPNLPEGSELLLHINDTNVRLLPLWRGGGELIEQFPVRFEARFLRAGINTLSFEVLIPGNPPDLPCAFNDTPILGLGEDSTLTVPFSPSMYLPDMQIAFAGLTPASVVTNDMSQRAFDADDVVTLRAALTAGARPEAAALNTQLHLLALDDLGTVPMGGYQLNRQAIDAALMPDTTITDFAPQTAPEHALLRFRDQTEQNTALLSRGWEWLQQGFWRTLEWLQPRSGLHLQTWLAEQDAQAILIQLDPARPNQLWMVRAPGSDVSAIASGIVAARTNAEGPRGQVSVLDRDGNWQSWIAPDRQPVLLESLSLTNIRHVTGNIVSAMPIRYVAGLFFLALVSALFALRLVIATREHKE
ncbi:cellulose biosynthesis cyclic di-GMP-binding regulatory protein BcsB [Pararhodobacter marinus]|uniref:cellulose biosynthesis cyclic di-GMP-binding regulatory protein BcsB n=1 Tax=Pararhodobacter marinus TaxID=2184063 RepID=UPI00351247AB